MKTELKIGKIVGFTGVAGSGLWTLELEDACVFIEASAGGRALVDCFGSLENIRGQEISYDVDQHNVLLGFNPLL